MIAWRDRGAWTAECGLTWRGVLRQMNYNKLTTLSAEIGELEVLKELFVS